MRTESILIPWLGPSLNSVYAGKHWSVRKKVADEGHKACLVARTVKPFSVPVSLYFQPVLGKGVRTLDCSNYALAAKIIEDGLVRCGVLKDDTPQYVRSIAILAPERGKQTGMKVTIETAYATGT